MAGAAFVTGRGGVAARIVAFVVAALIGLAAIGQPALAGVLALENVLRRGGLN